MPIKNPKDFDKTSTITPDLFVIGISEPDTNPSDVLVQAQSIVGGGSSNTKIIVDSNAIVYPQRARLTFLSPEFIVQDNLADDQTEVLIDTSQLMIKSAYDSDDNGFIDREAGGLGTDTSSLIGTLQVGDGTVSAIRNNYAATAAPGVADDNTKGYVIGSRWVYSNQEWVAVGVNTGAANWSLTTSVATGAKHIVQAGGSDLPARTFLNFIGSGLTNIFDDAPNDATIIQIEQADMLKSVYDADNDGIFGLEQGALGIDVSANGNEGFFFAGGTPATVGTILKTNLTSNANPVGTNDLTQNYSVGSWWHNSAPSAIPSASLFFCKEPTSNNAVWMPIGPTVTLVSPTDTVQTTRRQIKLESSDDSVTFTFTDDAANDRIIVDMVQSAPTVAWINRPPNTDFNVRDADHGKYFLLNGTHTVFLPGTATTSLRDGFQCSFILATASSEIQFVAEDGTVAVNGAGNVLTKQYGAIHCAYNLALNAHFIVGAFD